MKRTIESKVNGVTRLGVCRGQISGLGATLAERELKRTLSRSSSVARRDEKERMSKERILRRIEEKKERERLRMEENQRTKAMEELQARQKIIQEAENEMHRLEKERQEKEDMKAVEEKRKRDLAAAKVEEKRKRDLAIEVAEEKRKQDLATRKAAYEKKKRDRAAQLMREEEERKERKRQKIIVEAEKEKHRLEKERQEKEDIKRKAQEEVSRRIELKWQAKIDIARKMFVLKKWQTLMSEKKYRRDSTRQSLEHFDPIGQNLTFPFTNALQQQIVVNNAHVKDKTLGNYSRTNEEIFYRLGTDSLRAIDLSKILLSTLCNLNNVPSPSGHTVILFKLAVIVVEKNLVNVSKLVQTWINSRLEFDVVLREKLEGIEVRTVVVCRDLDLVDKDSFDAILFVILPTNTLDVERQVKSCGILSCIEHRVPYLVLRLDGREPRLMTHFGIVDKNVQCQSTEEYDRSKEEQYDDSLFAGCEALIQDYANSLCDKKRTPPASTMERVSVQKLCCEVMRRALWEICDNTECLPTHLQREAFNRSEEKIVEHCRDALIALLQEITHLGNDTKHGRLSCWPESEFVDPSTGEVPSYFAGDKGLPKNWRQLLNPSKLKEIVWALFPSFAQPTPAIAVLEEILIDAPLQVRQMCGEMFEDKRTRSCFESAFQWQESIAEISGEAVALCLPQGEAANLIDLAIDGLIQETLSSTTTYISDASHPLPLALSEDKSSLRVGNLDSTVDETSNLELQQDNTEKKSTEKSYLLPSNNLSSLGQNRRSKRSVSSYPKNKREPKENGVVVGEMKRQKINEEGICSNLPELHESKLFTAKLQSLLNGDMTMDITIGDTTLANIVSYECEVINSK